MFVFPSVYYLTRQDTIIPLIRSHPIDSMTPLSCRPQALTAAWRNLSDIHTFYFLGCLFSRAAPWCGCMSVAAVSGQQERPRSAVEQQLCAAESGRPRMSVEEQLERIRRHQQGALREKKKSLSFRGSSQENTPSRSHSFTKNEFKENHLRSVQVLCKPLQGTTEVRRTQRHHF